MESSPKGNKTSSGLDTFLEGSTIRLSHIDEEYQRPYSISFCNFCGEDTYYMSYDVELIESYSDGICKVHLFKIQEEIVGLDPKSDHKPPDCYPLHAVIYLRYTVYKKEKVLHKELHFLKVKNSKSNKIVRLLHDVKEEKVQKEILINTLKKVMHL